MPKRSGHQVELSAVAGKLTAALALIVVLAVTLSGCSNGPKDPFSDLPPVEWHTEPLELEWYTPSWRPIDWVIDYHDGIAHRVRAEAEWCRRNGTRTPSGEEFLEIFPIGTDRYQMSAYYTPVGADDLAWIEEIARETAARRELELLILPAVVAVTPDTFRRSSCFTSLKLNANGTRQIATPSGSSNG